MSMYHNNQEGVHHLYEKLRIYNLQARPIRTKKASIPLTTMGGRFIMERRHTPRFLQSH